MDTFDTFSLGNVRAAIVIDDRREKKSGLFPVKYRINYMKKRVYYPSGIDVSPSEWESLPHTRKKELQEQRELIQNGFDKIKAIIKELEKGEGFTVEALNIRLARGMKNSIITAFKDKIDQLNKNNQVGTATVYQTTLNNILQFISRDLKFSEITPEWLRRYEKYMIDTGKSFTTVAWYMRTLRSIMNEGMEQGIITASQYPFKKYEIPTGEGRKMALTLSQIGEVLKYPLVNDKDKMCRDLWFFSYLCNGINVNDMLRLKYSNIHENEIRFFRQKTIRTKRHKKEITAVLLPEMQQIINKWGNPESTGYLFPFLNEGIDAREEKRVVICTTEMINRRMKLIGKALGYGSISTYCARHSYATVLKRSGANIAFISESLGHADMKTTENYLDSFEKEEREKNAALLTKFE